MSVVLALALYVCITPSGWVETMTFTVPRGPQADAWLTKALATAWRPAPGSSCRWVDPAELPPSIRPDPRRPDMQITQRHRWRGLPDGRIVVDPTAMRPHGDAIRREYQRLVPPARWGEVVATPLGFALDRAIREDRWQDVRAALAQTGAAQPLTAAEIARLQAILRDYEAD